MSLRSLIEAYDNLDQSCTNTDLRELAKNKDRLDFDLIEPINRCVHGDTMILTYQGYKKIKYLVKRLVSIWNGSQWSLSMVTKSCKTQNLIAVSTSDGITLQCTPFHRFVLNTGQCIEAYKLMPGDTLMSCAIWPMIDGLADIDKFRVPINASIHDKRSWLSKFIDSNKSTDTTLTMLVLECCSKDVATDVKYLSNTIGCSCSVYSNNKTSQVIFSPRESYYLFQIMRLPSKYRQMETEINRNITNHITISSVTSVEGIHDTYEINEPLNHTAIFNGLLTKN